MQSKYEFLNRASFIENIFQQAERGNGKAGMREKRSEQSIEFVKGCFVRQTELLGGVTLSRSLLSLPGCRRGVR